MEHLVVCVVRALALMLDSFSLAVFACVPFAIVSFVGFQTTKGRTWCLSVCRNVMLQSVNGSDGILLCDAIMNPGAQVRPESVRGASTLTRFLETIAWGHKSFLVFLVK